MMYLPDKIGEELIKQTALLLEKFYDDVLHPPAKEIGEALGNIAKTICLLSYPFMLLGAVKDRISKKVSKIANDVPEDVRVMPNSQLFLEYLDKTKFIPDGSALMASFDRLLASAINKEKRNFIHPAFVLILSQLSSDEILIIEKLKNSNFKMTRRCHCDPQTMKFYKTEIIENEFPLDSLFNKELYLMYTTHLHKLDLTNFLRTLAEAEKDTQGRQIASIETSTLMLSEFGELFAQVCCESN